MGAENKVMDGWPTEDFSNCADGLMVVKFAAAFASGYDILYSVHTL